MESWWIDIRYGLRRLAKKPKFTAIAALTLALGIGANISIFSVIDGLILRPLPYGEPDRINLIFETNAEKGLDQFSVSAPNFLDWREQSQTFEHIAAFDTRGFNLMEEGRPERVVGGVVSSNLFQSLGVEPIRGRIFSREEETPGRDKVALLSYGIWQRMFGADEGILGRPINLNSSSYTVIGVMPRSFEFPLGADRTELWIPLAFEPEDLQRASHQLQVVGRLKSGVTLQQAQQEMSALARNLEEQYPASNAGWGARVVSLHEHTVKDVKLALWVLQAAVALVLLICCANVANLLLAKSSSRQKELALCSALGAGRLRLIRLLLIESMLLTLSGCAAGTALANWATMLLKTLAPSDIPLLSEVSINGQVLLFALAISLLTGILVGIIPALRATKVNLTETLKEGGRSSATFRRSPIRNLLVIAEMALAIVPLTGAGMLIESFLRLQSVDPGFKAESILTFRTILPTERYSEEQQWANFFQHALQRIGSIPGAESCAAISHLPLSRGNLVFDFSIEGRPRSTADIKQTANFRCVSSDYFQTLGIPLAKGRLFAESDAPGTPQVVIINQTVARRYWPDDDPVGKRIIIGYGPPVAREIVGVVGDVKQSGLEAESQPELYLPYLQTPLPFMSFVVRSSNPAALASAVRQEMLAISKDQPVYDIRSLEDVVSEAVGRPRFTTLLLSILASLAMAIASVGIYGVLSYSVVERSHEIGIRIALGAPSGHVIRLVVGQGMLLTLAGVAIGLAVAAGFTSLITGLLYKAEAASLPAFASVAGLLTAVALMACYIPARRASKIDPIVALRYE
jgi:putative ABC transport system permease protein